MERHSFTNTSPPPLRTFDPPAFNAPRPTPATRFTPSKPDTNNSSRSFALRPLNLLPSPNHNQQPAASLYPPPPPPPPPSQSLPPPAPSPSPVSHQAGLEIDPWNRAQNPHPAEVHTSGTSPSIPDTAFVDLLATSTGMDASQRADFQFFFKQCNGMPSNQLSAFLLCYAQQIATMNRIANYNSQLDRLTILINQLAARLETSFELTPMQKTNLASIVKDVMVQKSRASYRDMYLDVLTVVNAEALSLGLASLSDANKKKLTTYIKRTCSTYRNSFRREILHSVKGGKTRCSLSQFLFRIGQGDWFRTPADRDSPRLRVQFAIYRRLAFDNHHIISSESNEDGDCDDGYPSDGDDDEERPRKRARTSTGSAPTPRRGKRKTSSPAWWDFVAQWFMERRKEWGLDMNSNGWSQYIHDTMAWERANFPEPAVFETTNATPGPSTSSTQGIFGALYTSSSSSGPSAFTFTPPSA